MPDNKSKPGGQDRQRINVNEDYELHDWAAKLGVPPGAVREAVSAVGDRADKVQAYLAKGGSSRKG